MDPTWTFPEAGVLQQWYQPFWHQGPVDNLSPEGGRGDGSAAIQEHHIGCAFNFYYYITSTSDHQTSGPKVGDPCSRGGTVGRKAGKVRVGSWELWNPPIPGTSEKYCGF